MPATAHMLLMKGVLHSFANLGNRLGKYVHNFNQIGWLTDMIVMDDVGWRKKVSTFTSVLLFCFSQTRCLTIFNIQFS